MVQAQRLLDNCTPDQRVELVKRSIGASLCKNSLFYLGKEILGYKDFCSSQVEWDKWVTGNVDLAGKRAGKYLVLQPRETYKTSFFTITLSICLLLNNPELSILIANERYENARDMLREIKRHLETNTKLRMLFGDYVNPVMWAETSITISRKTRNIKEPSIWVCGIGMAVTSKHPDVIICDDIAGRKDKESEAGRQQTLSFFQDQWDLLKKDAGQLFVVGTRKHIFDIYHHIKDSLNPQLEKEKMDCFKVLETPAHRPDGSLNFPRLLSEAKLNELRVVKADSDGIDFSTYMAEYELQPLDPKTQIFKTLHFVDIKNLKYSKLCQWTDPAMATEKDSCYSAIIVIGRIAEGEHKNKCVVVHASLDKRPLTVVVKDHNRIYRHWHALFPDVEYQVLMESNGFNGLKELSLLSSLQDGGEPVPTKGKPQTENKDTRIQSTEPAVTTGVLMFREDWLTAPDNYKLLIEQYRNYPQAMKDGPDAGHGAYKNISRTGAQVR